MRSLPRLLIALALGLPSALLADLSPSAGAKLPLSTYLADVAKVNDTLMAVHSQNASLDLAAMEPQTAFSPNLSADYAHNETAMENNTSTTPNYNVGSSWGLGLSKLFGTGTYVSLGYQSAWSLSNYDISNPSLYDKDWYTASPTLSINQSLWKGFGARGANIAQDKVNATYGSLKEFNNLKAQSLLMQAEAAYVQLALARATVQVQEASLERYKKILEWSKRRAEQNLADRVDVLQTQAAVKQIEVALSSARQSLKAAARNFNALRSRDDDQVIESLDDLSMPQAESFERKADRADLKAARLQLQADSLAVDEVVEKYRPDVSVFGKASLSGGNEDYGKAFANEDQLAWVAGVKVSANIDLPLISKVIDGAKTATGSSERTLEQKRRDLDKDWDNLATQWQSVQERLAQAEELVSLQKEKSEREKLRFTNGRTTNYQVLSFETDYNNALLMRLGLIAEARILAATAKMYNNGF